MVLTHRFPYFANSTRNKFGKLGKFGNGCNPIPLLNTQVEAIFALKSKRYFDLVKIKRAQWQIHVCTKLYLGFYQVFIRTYPELAEIGIAFGNLI